MIPYRRNPLTDVSLDAYQPRGVDVAPSPTFIPQMQPMNIEHAQFAPEDNSVGNALGGLGRAFLQRRPMMNKGNMPMSGDMGKVML